MTQYIYLKHTCYLKYNSKYYSLDLMSFVIIEFGFLIILYFRNIIFMSLSIIALNCHKWNILYFVGISFTDFLETFLFEFKWNWCSRSTKLMQLVKCLILLGFKHDVEFFNHNHKIKEFKCNCNLNLYILVLIA